MTVIFKCPEPSEARTFATTHIQCWREAYGQIVPRAVLDATDLDSHTERWTTILQEPDRFVLGAYAGEQPVGFVNACQRREELYEGEDGHIAAIYVLAQYHRRGIGRQLLGAAARWWLARGGHALGLTALAENLPARQFYAAAGGHLLKTGTYVWHGFELPDVVYHFGDLRFLAAAAPTLEKGQ